jgi:hypothetical protein
VALRRFVSSGLNEQRAVAVRMAVAVFLCSSQSLLGRNCICLFAALAAFSPVFWDLVLVLDWIMLEPHASRVVTARVC